MSKAQLAVIGLGGTIAMRSKGSGAVPGLTAEDLVALLPDAASTLVHRVENYPADSRCPPVPG